MLFIKRKYPFIKHKLSTVFIVSIVVVMFIFIFEPFGFDLYKGSKIGVAFGFGANTFISMLFFNFILKKQLGILVKKWTILYEILYIVSLILLITIINYVFFSIVLLDYYFNFLLFLRIIYFTFFIGIIPASILVIVKYNFYLKKELNCLVDTETEEQDLDIVISNQLIREKGVKIKLNDFLFAEADKNNVSIYYFYNNEIVNKTIRTTMSAVENETNHPNIFRCHRSFIINLNKLESAKGNSNGYQVYLKNYKKYIPVSRKYVELFKEQIF